MEKKIYTLYAVWNMQHLVSERLESKNDMTEPSNIKGFFKGPIAVGYLLNCNTPFYNSLKGKIPLYCER